MRAIGKTLHGKVAHECLVSCPHPCSQPISCQMRVELRCVGSRAAPRFRCPHPRDGPSTFASLPSGWKRLFVSARFECIFVLRSASAWLFGSRWPHVEQIQTFPAIALEGVYWCVDRIVSIPVLQHHIKMAEIQPPNNTSQLVMVC